MAHELPPLPYGFDALEPHIDAQTMQIHHGKHHATYVAKLNEAIEKEPSLKGKSVEELLSNINSIPESVRTAVNNHGGGHLNHTIFWNNMMPKGGGEPTGELAEAIKSVFGGFEKFKEHFSTTAAGHFGSGWAWLCLDKSGKLAVRSFLNQNNPLTEGFKPLLGLDVWEHAYYLKYQNRRPEYINAWWSTVCWKDVGQRYAKAK